MPVRSLHSPLLKWPDRRTVDDTLRTWVDDAVHRHPETRRIGVFGSFARGEFAFGSDLDLIVIVEDSDLAPDVRARTWDVSPLPVPADLLLYTTSEWQRLQDTPSRFRDTLAREVQWLWTEEA